MATDIIIDSLPSVTVGSLPALAAGTNTIGAISNTTFTVTQGTGTNLHTTVDNWPATQQTLGKKGAKHITNPALSTTATLLLAANANRISALIVNSSTQTIYIGNSSSVTTTANKITLTAGQTYNDGDSNDAWYAIVATGTPSIDVVEVY